MAANLRIATFNVENLDETEEEPTLEERIVLMRPQMLRLRADVLCLQEVHAQGEKEERTFSALDQLLEETPYADYERVTTRLESGDQPYAERNLVILSRFPISSYDQYKHDFAPAPAYKLVTADPAEEAAERLTWERPILHARLELPDGGILNVLNLHLKSKRPSNVPGQKKDPYTWKSASGWAEGFFLSSMRRVGQALETRMLVDDLFDEDEEARIVIAGDFNADVDDVPVQAIRGAVEQTGNGDLARRVMVPCENSIPDSTTVLPDLPGPGRDARPRPDEPEPATLLSGRRSPQRAATRRVGSVRHRRQIPRERSRARSRFFRNTGEARRRAAPPSPPPRRPAPRKSPGSPPGRTGRAQRRRSWGGSSSSGSIFWMSTMRPSESM